MQDTQTIKLQAFLAQAGIASRRASEVLIAEGKIIVNGVPAHIGQRINPSSDVIIHNGVTINDAQQTKKYFLLDKPRGYVSTTSDELNRKTVLDLLPKATRDSQIRLYPVGRLDIDSEGLLLITNDGALAQKLTHPKFRIAKTYHVLVTSRPSGLALNHLRRGVKLKDGYTNPAEVTMLSSDKEEHWLEISITEGRNRQVRRMMDRVGYPVERLVRVSMGPLNLDMLDGERWHELTQTEIQELFYENNRA